MSERPVLLTGATGHVGGRLLGALLERGLRVRCLTRRPDELADGLDPRVEVAGGDVRDRASLDDALAGCRAAYYLVHSLGEPNGLEEAELDGAETFAAAAADAGLERIVYLGGLAHGDDLSDHMRTRHEVGRVLRESPVPTIEFRASIVIGEGSASFELIRTLVEALPALALPDWVEAETQPIAVDDVVAYLVEALDVPLVDSRVFEIGGPDRVTYRELIGDVATRLGLQTATLSLPAPPPLLSSESFFLTRFLPERVRVALKLIESLRFDSTVRDDAALRTFSVSPRPVGAAIRAALAQDETAAADH